MSKVIKQMEMNALKQSFEGVRDIVVLSVKGLTSQADHGLRMALRKKNIRLQVVKNSLTRRVFHEMGLNVADDSPYWVGPTTMAWGASSISELSRAVDAELKNPKLMATYKDKVAVKGAIADGQSVGFDMALKMPTKAEAIARVVMLALAPASRLLGQITAPAARVASQIKQISEKPSEEAVPAPTPA
jgi:large subunit ribosomal protein L10